MTTEPLHPLRALSPLDGRYAEAAAPLTDYFSEFAYLRDRVRVELDFLTALSETGLMRPLTASDSARFDSVKSTFTLADAESIQAHERVTRHDVKAIEYFLRDRLEFPDLLPWIHFGLTSEDVNNIAQALALKASRDKVLLPALDALRSDLAAFALQYKALPMPARTHGQYSVPTTLGKEFAVYVARLGKVLVDISSFRFEAKLTGAVGNFNALHAAAPNVDWVSFSENFVSNYGLEPNLFTTQLLPYDNWVRYFDLLRLINSILLDLAQNTWRYISDGYLKQAVVSGEVGSSTMPQKVNPIDFENAEGNLGVANSLLTHYAQKLTVSRLQRDLSDSTVRRTFGTGLGHSLIAWSSLQRGLQRVAPDDEKLRAELMSHWEVVSEGAQTILRAAGRLDAYETLKEQTRGRILTRSDYIAWCDAIDVDDSTHKKLAALSPETYLGLAIELTDKALRWE